MTTKERVRAMIDDMPEQKLIAIESILQQIENITDLADDYISDAEYAEVRMAVDEYKSDPSTGVSLSELFAKNGVNIGKLETA
ncbi:MAG: hypothetical protein LBL41_05365 [Bifidobacteriaceae bacterium]|jgi:hypothetical protein|nr:hypothetical protein [Bifidobacteriaceae bacterium]